MSDIKSEFELDGSYDMKFKLGNNMEYITGYLMQEGKREQEKLTPESIKVSVEVIETK